MHLVSSYNLSLCDSGFILSLGTDSTSEPVVMCIGLAEAQSLSLALRRVQLNRPLAHDLMVSLINSAEARLVKVIINRLQDGIFCSELHLMTPGGERILDSRPSDAVALAVRIGAPVYLAHTVLQDLGIGCCRPSTATEDDEDALRRQIETAIQHEMYEQAAIIRDRLLAMRNHN